MVLVGEGKVVSVIVLNPFLYLIPACNLRD